MMCSGGKSAPKVLPKRGTRGERESVDAVWPDLDDPFGREVAYDVEQVARLGGEIVLAPAACPEALGQSFEPARRCRNDPARTVLRCERGSGAGQGTPPLSMRPRLVWSIFRTRPPEWMIRRPPPVASDVVSGELFRSPSKRDQSSVVHPSKRTSLVNIFDGNRSTTSPVPRGSRSRSAISAGRPLKYRRGRRHICRSSDRPRRRRQSAFFGRCSACSVRFLRASELPRCNDLVARVWRSSAGRWYGVPARQSHDR